MTDRARLPRAHAVADCGHLLDTRPDIVFSRAPRVLVHELWRYGLDTRLRARVGAVDATTFGVSESGRRRRVAQRALLRRHSGRLWWWLLWPGPPAGHPDLPVVTPLVPANETVEAARRIHRVLVLADR